MSLSNMAELETERLKLHVRPLGQQLGSGTYGNVEEVEIPGVVCVAKTIREELFTFQQHGEITSKIMSECKVISNLCHPNIVQFLGVCYLPGSALPSLVMERLETSLHDLLKSTLSLTLATKQSVLIDVAQGLLYLHCQPSPVIHRNLTATNVLINSALVAKIGDTGVASLVDIQPNQLPAPIAGVADNEVYMSPESRGEHAEYNTSHDIFSYGNIALFTLTQEFPGQNLLVDTCVHPVSEKITVLSEIERRKHYFQMLNHQLGEKNMFIKLIHDCLQNSSSDRPTAFNLVEILRKLPINAANSDSLAKLEVMRQLSSFDNKIQHLLNLVHKCQEEAREMDDQITPLELMNITKEEMLERRDEQVKELQEMVRSQKEQTEQIEEKLGELLKQEYSVSNTVFIEIFT